MRSLECRASNGTGDDKDSTTKTIYMAPYSLHRAHTTLSALQHKPEWSLSDTASFDCMHYDGDAALDHLATKLNLKQGQHILDIGSGFSATGRVLCSKYGVDVTGVELQKEVHDLARLITARNEDEKVREGVSSVCADFLAIREEELGTFGFDHVVSLLCIMHLPQKSRETMFKRAARYLKPGGEIYIEDFYQKQPLTEDDQSKLRNVVACSHLPETKAYTQDVEAAGFVNVEFDDVSTHWTHLLVERARSYKAEEKRDTELELFYDTVAELFKHGNVGGVRLTAKLRC